MPTPAWREQAPCTGTPSEWWFPVDDYGRALADHVPLEADALCDSCPVHGECYEYALHHERYGVFAGIHEVQRARLRKQRRIRLRNDPDFIAEERVRAALAAEASLFSDDDEDVRSA